MPPLNGGYGVISEDARRMSRFRHRLMENGIEHSGKSLITLATGKTVEENGETPNAADVMPLSAGGQPSRYRAGTARPAANGGSMAWSSLTPRMAARVGAIDRMSISPKFRPGGTPGPTIMKVASMRGSCAK